MSEEKHSPLSSERGPYRLAIFDKDDKFVMAWTQVKVDNVRPKVEQIIAEMLRLHGGKPEPCSCFHCIKARELEAALKSKP